MNDLPILFHVDDERRSQPIATSTAMQSATAQARTTSSRPAPAASRARQLDAASPIIASASSTVNVFGFWIGGNSLNVSTNLATTACAASARIPLLIQLGLREVAPARELTSFSLRIFDLFFAMAVPLTHWLQTRE